MEERLLGRLLSRSGSGAAARRGWKCDRAEALAAYLDGAGSDAERQRRERHYSECSYCRAEIAALVKLSRHDPDPVPPGLMHRALAVEKTAADPRWGWRWAMLGTTAAALAAIAWAFYPSPQVSSPTVARVEAPAAAPANTSPVVVAENKPRPTGFPREVRSGAPGAKISMAILAPQADSTFRSTGAPFAWSAVTGALFYEIRVFTEHGDVVWQTREHATKVAMPADLELSPGPYYVMVRAELSEGRNISSPAVRFMVAP